MKMNNRECFNENETEKTELPCDEAMDKNFHGTETGCTKRKKLVAVVCGFLTVILFAAAFLFFTSCGKYAWAKINIAMGNYDGAYYILKDLEHKNYADAINILRSFECVPVKKTMTSEHGITQTYTCEVEIGHSYLKKTVYDEKNVLTEEIEKKYTQDGNCSETIVTSSTLEETTHKYTYDDNGNLIKELLISGSGMQLPAEYVYDRNNRRIKSIITLYGDKKTTATHSYDEKGNCIKDVYSEDDGSKGPSVEYFYDNYNCIREITNYSSGDTSTTEYVYDSKNNCIKKTFTSKNGDISTFNATYDSKGNCVKEMRTDSEGKITATEYSGYKVYYMGK